MDAGRAVKQRPALLTRLVEQMLAYFRELRLDADEELEADPGGAGPSSPPSVWPSSPGRSREEREQTAEALLKQCAETYGQLLLANSRVTYCRLLAQTLAGEEAAAAVAAGTADASDAADGQEVEFVVRTDARMWEVKDALARWLGRPDILTETEMGTRLADGMVVTLPDEERLGHRRAVLVLGQLNDLHPEKGSPAVRKAQREAAARLRKERLQARRELREAVAAGCAAELRAAIERVEEVGVPDQGGAPGKLADNAAEGEGELERARQRLRELESDEESQNPAQARKMAGRKTMSGDVQQGTEEPTPARAPPTGFFEAVYAIVTRAVQHSYGVAPSKRPAGAAATQPVKSPHMQLAARIEKELAKLFRSPDFSLSAGKGYVPDRRGGRSKDGSQHQDSTAGRPGRCPKNVAQMRSPIMLAVLPTTTVQGVTSPDWSRSGELFQRGGPQSARTSKESTKLTNTWALTPRRTAHQIGGDARRSVGRPSLTLAGAVVARP